MAEWFRALHLIAGGAWFKSSTQLLSGFVPGSPQCNSFTALTNCSASHQLRFLIVNVLFKIFVYLISLVTPLISTTLPK